ncbi:MAG: phosphopantothenoylcysteine decarboxylase [Planctomycetota bacterium]
MARIVITSGPTRQYIDPVRYLSNASSGQMGRCLAEAALEMGHEVVIISGPVNIQYPQSATVIDVVSTRDMLAAAMSQVDQCDGIIGAAAPCDYQPENVADHKIRKTGETLTIDLVETQDVMAAVGQIKSDAQWSVGFALETDDARFRALTKLQKKNCDLVVLNGVSAIDSPENSVEIIAPDGSVIESASGSKPEVARFILNVIQSRLIDD